MTWTAPTVIIAVAALALSIYNAVVARRAPAIARQQQLWDELRTVLEPLVPALRETRMALRQGTDVESEPQLILDGERRILALAPRFTEPGVQGGLNLLQARISAAKTPWDMAVFHQDMLKTVSVLPPDGPFALDAARKREQDVRRRDAMHRELEVKLDAAIDEVQKWIKRLDALDKSQSPRSLR